MHLPHLILDLALILAGASVVGIIFKFLKQPLVLGYIIAGIIVGPYFSFFPTVIEMESIKIWADIGVIILLFNLGLEFSFKKLIKEGLRVVIIALFGVLLTLLSGFCLGKLLGWSNMDSLFMGGILSIASTTIIIRAFEELGVKSQKFTNIVTSVLIVEDLVAVILMVILSTISISREFQGVELLFSVSKLLFFLVLWFVSGIFFLPSLLKAIKPILNEEVLLIVSLALCFGVVIMALKAGFSPAFGAFIMGSILAETTKAERIEHAITPLKNLFGAIFFVSVGMLLDPAMILQNLFPIFVSAVLLLIGKPLFIIMGSLVTGQPLRISIQTGLSLSQIGEFSFIIASLGLSLKVTSAFLYPVAVAVSVLTTFTTPYMIKLSSLVHGMAEKHIPSKWKESIANYSISAEKINNISEWRRLVRSTLLYTLILSVIIVTVIVFSTHAIQNYFWDNTWSRIITAAITITFISPFLWALAFRISDKETYSKIWMHGEYRAHLILLQISRIGLSLFYIGFLFDRLFSFQIAMFGLLVTCVILFLFSRKIKMFYGKIEDRFKLNLHERELHQKKVSRDLTPWDTHLSNFRLNAISPFIGKTLLESKIRETFGVNIAAIERENLTINVPDRFERLYPQDTISVIGTDEQLKRFKDFLQKSEQGSDILVKRNEVKLIHFVVQKGSSLIGKSIKHSNIRELSKGLVVGIEREDKKILNPESDEVFREEDVIWIVGNEKRIQVLAGERRG